MNRRQQSPQHRPKIPAYCQAFERLDAALAENTRTDYSEKIRQRRAECFADADKLVKSGQGGLPE